MLTTTLGVWIRDGPLGHWWAAAWSYVRENTRLRAELAETATELESVETDLTGLLLLARAEEAHGGRPDAG